MKTAKTILFVITCLVCISAGVDIIITNGNGTTATGTSIDWGGIITKDVHIDPDTTGNGYICFGCKKGIEGFQIFVKDSLNHKQSASLFMSGGLFGFSATDISFPSGPGIQFIAGNDAVTLIDTNPVPKGLMMGGSYENDPLSTTTKGYVDKNIVKTVTKTTMGSAALPMRIIFVSNATGGSCPAWNDGTNWRRFVDNSIIN